MDVTFFKPFVDGSVKTLKVQCQLDAVPGKPFKKGDQDQPPFDIAGVIAVQSKAFTGSITLCFTKKLYLAAMGRMLGETYNDITPELRDGAAELLNIIFGVAKAVLNDAGHTLERAIPTVIQGSNLRTSINASSPVYVLPFTTEAGEYQIEICIEEN